MACREYRYLIGTEEAETLAENEPLQAHLRECAECAQLAREMQQLAGVLRGLNILEPSETFAQSVSAKIAAPAPALRPWWQRLLDPFRGPTAVLEPRQALAAAGLIVLIVALLAVVFHHSSGPAPVTAVPAVTSPSGNRLGSPPAGTLPSDADGRATGTDHTTR